MAVSLNATNLNLNNLGDYSNSIGKTSSVKVASQNATTTQATDEKVEQSAQGDTVTISSAGSALSQQQTQELLIPQVLQRLLEQHLAQVIPLRVILLMIFQATQNHSFLRCLITEKLHSHSIILRLRAERLMTQLQTILRSKISRLRQRMQHRLKRELKNSL